LPPGGFEEYPERVEVAMATRLRGLLVTAAAVLAGVLLAAPTAGARQTANLSLNVTFFTNGQITMALPDGTPVGTTSGAPTMIPAGYYALMMNGPGGCTSLPHFILKGPGENVVDNLTEGEVTNFQYNAYFLPNSTYTWRNDANPSVVYTFATTNDVLGSPPPAAPGSKGLSASSHGSAQSQDVLGSGLAVTRGTLTAAVSPSGTLSLSFKGKAARSLKPGKYTVKVSDASTNGGFMLVKGSQTLTFTTKAFVGKRTRTVVLTAGKWSLVPVAGGKATALTVAA
jgi:hypothetical protein